MSDIKPALTPEQWAGGWEGEYSPKGCHQEAAFCLHGQPFGFTRADVDLLREQAVEWRRKAQAIGPEPGLSADDSHYSLALAFDEDAVECDSLADRIETLIPPPGVVEPATPG